MIVSHLADFLRRHQVSIASLAQQLNVDPASLLGMANGQVNKLDLALVDRICQAVGARSLAEIIEYRPDSSVSPPNQLVVDKDLWEIEPESAAVKFDGKELVIFWIDTTMCHFLEGIDHFTNETSDYVLLYCGRRTGEINYKPVQDLGAMSEDFLEGQASSAFFRNAGWGIFRIAEIDRRVPRIVMTADNTWEVRAHRSAHPGRGCSFFPGYWSGLWSKHFGTNLWVRETKCQAKGDELCEYIIEPASTTLESISATFLSQKMKDLAALNAVAAAMTQSLELETILNDTLAKTLEVLTLDGGAIHLLDPHTGQLSLTSHRGISEALVDKMRSFQVSDDLVGRVVALEEPVVLTDLSQDPNLRWLGMATEGVESFVSVPLKAKDQVSGALSLVSRNARHFTPRDVEMLTSVCNQIGVAIHNASLYRTTQQTVHQLSAVAEIGREITSLDLEAVLSVLTRRVIEIIDAGLSCVWLIDRDGSLVPYKTCGEKAAMIKNRRLALGEGLAGWAAQTGKMLTVRDMRSSGRLAPDSTLPAAGFTSCLIAPLKAGGRVAGVLAVYSEGERQFTPQETTLLSLIADQGAIAIENARLFRQLEEQSVQLGSRVEELTTLNEVARAASSSLEPEVVAQRTVDKILELLGVSVCSIWVANWEQQRAEIIAHGGYPKGLLSELQHLPFETGYVVIEAIKRGELLFVRDANRSSDFPESRLALARMGVEDPSYAAVPLRGRNRVVGALFIASDRSTPFPTAELDFISTLANQVGVAIENAQFYDQTVQKAEELRGLYRSLNAEEEKLTAIFDNISDAILIVDQEKRIIRSNPALRQLVGRPRAKLIGTPCNQVLRCRDQQGREMCAQDCPMSLVFCRDQAVTYTEARVFSGDGREVDIAASFNRVASPAGDDYGVAVIRDISKVKEIDRLKSEFVSTVSHELRTPLTNIKGFTMTLLREDMEIDSVVQRDFLQIISIQTERLARLIDDLLMLSRVESGAMRFRAEPLALKDLVGKTLEAIKGQTDKHRFAVRNTESWPNVIGDEDKLDQILSNLLSNAVKYSPNGGEIRVDVRSEGAFATISISDQGIGISPENLDRVFERFYRIDNSSTRKIGGTGLGLYVCKGLVEAMGGVISVTSEWGKGSCFTFTLPLDPRSENPGNLSI